MRATCPLCGKIFKKLDNYLLNKDGSFHFSLTHNPQVTLRGKG